MPYPYSTVSIYPCAHAHALIRTSLITLLLALSLSASAQPETYHSAPLPLQADSLAKTNMIVLNTHGIVPGILPRSDAQETQLAKEDRAGREKKVPLLAVSTNLVMEAGTVLAKFHTVPLNLGLELPLGKHWSVFADYTSTVPWRAYNNNADCFQLMQGHLGGRWYPSKKRPLGGWYVYAQAGGGYYDFERDGKGYQGEDFLAAIGGGYSIAFGEHFRLNLGVGIGPILTHYRYYEGRMANQHLMYRYSGNWQYFGVTDAKISITWLFYRKKK